MGGWEALTRTASKGTPATTAWALPDCAETALSAHPMFLQKSTEHMKKTPTIVLSITYKGVKFIDASNKVRCSRGLCAPLTNKTAERTNPAGSEGPALARLPLCDEAVHQRRRRLSTWCSTSSGEGRNKSLGPTFSA